MIRKNILILKSVAVVEKEISFPEKTRMWMYWDYRDKSFNYKLTIFIDANDYIQDLIKSAWCITDLPELLLEIKEANEIKIVLEGKNTKYIPCSHITKNHG
jgi:hypothetical protein